MIVATFPQPSSGRLPASPCRPPRKSSRQGHDFPTGGGDCCALVRHELTAQIVLTNQCGAWGRCRTVRHSESDPLNPRWRKLISQHSFPANRCSISAGSSLLIVMAASPSAPAPLETADNGPVCDNACRPASAFFVVQSIGVFCRFSLPYQPINTAVICYCLLLSGYIYYRVFAEFAGNDCLPDPA